MLVHSGSSFIVSDALLFVHTPETTAKEGIGEGRTRIRGILSNSSPLTLEDGLALRNAFEMWKSHTGAVCSSVSTFPADGVT